MIKYFLPVLLLLLSCSTSRTDLSEWRGTDRMGIYPDKDLLKEWPEEGPEELWTIDSLGRGFGSPQFTEDRFYITGEVDGMAILYCFDLNGNKLWQSTLGKEWVSTYPGSRSAPTIVGELIYIGTGMGDLYCVSRADGSLVWSKDFTEEDWKKQERQSIRSGYNLLQVGQKISTSPQAITINIYGIGLNFSMKTKSFVIELKTASKDSFVSIEKAQKVLGFDPQHSNQDAMIRNYRWYLANKDTFTLGEGVSHRLPWKQKALKLLKVFF